MLTTKYRGIFQNKTRGKIMKRSYYKNILELIDLAEERFLNKAKISSRRKKLHVRFTNIKKYIPEIFQSEEKVFYPICHLRYFFEKLMTKYNKSLSKVISFSIITCPPCFDITIKKRHTDIQRTFYKLREALNKFHEDFANGWEVKLKRDEYIFEQIILDWRCSPAASLLFLFHCYYNQETYYDGKILGDIHKKIQLNLEKVSGEAEKEVYKRIFKVSCKESNLEHIKQYFALQHNFGDFFTPTKCSKRISSRNLSFQNGYY